jgi:hypothetical protein
LASGSKVQRDRALADLTSTIYHQGTIYSASVAAVPFILEIVASSEAADRTPALQLLQALSTGTSYHEVHASLFPDRAAIPEWKERIREEKSWVTAIHERLIEGLAVVIQVLRAGRVEERLAAVSLLATLRENAEAIDAIHIAASESEPSLCAAALSALGLCDDPPLELFERQFEQASSELVRTAAAVQILYHLGKDAALPVVNYLLEHLRKPQVETRKAYQALPDVGPFLGDLGKAFACGSRTAAEEAFPLLFEEVKRSKFSLDYDETFGLLILAISLNPPPELDWSKITITPRQRMTIRLVADRAWRIWRGVPTTSVNIVELLEQVGLPGKRDEVFALLAGTPEGVQTPREASKWSGRRSRWSWWKTIFK